MTNPLEILKAVLTVGATFAVVTSVAFLVLVGVEEILFHGKGKR